MDSTLTIAAQQLGRMRGMTALYHRRFFFDINLTTVVTFALFIVGWWGIPEAFLLIPVTALIGAVQTAFDASYLIFARTYAARLEAFINDELDAHVLAAAAMEDAYLFPLGTRKVVSVPLDGTFSWFAFVTLFYTIVGAASFAFGLALGWDTLRSGSEAMGALYLVLLIGLGIGAIATGVWWFVGGTGERRLQRVLDAAFGPIDAD
jgi:hypothetical protein